MELFEILASVVVVVSLLLVVGGFLIVGPERFLAIRSDLRTRIRVALPYLGVLGIVLLINARFRTVFEEISSAIGINITPLIFRIEGFTIVWIQDVFGPGFAEFFSVIYVYGYVFLLVFPFIAYFVHQHLENFKAITLAYTANYGIGLISYIVFIAFGPRNMISDVSQDLFITQFQLLTSQVNEPTNVFPSLHTSLSATVLLFAWRTRKSYPIWVPVAGFLCLSIIVSTMYLAKHWFLDVVVGIGLAWVSYWIGLRAVENDWLGRIQLRERVHWLRNAFRS